jgi:sugar lactone lactonase YvrE
MAGYALFERVQLGHAFRALILTALLLSCGSLGAQQYTVSTVAGGAPPPTPAVAVNSSIGQLQGVATDGAGNVYFTSLNCVFKVDGTGTLTRIAGTSRPGFSGDGGPAINAQLNLGTGLFHSSGLAVDPGGNIYVPDSGNARVRKVSAAGIITTFAGGGGGGDGSLATNASLNSPVGVALDLAGNVYIADGVVRKVGTNGIITTVAGGGNSNPGDGGPATSALFLFVSGVAVDNGGNLLIATLGRIRRVSNGIISTVAGTGGYTNDSGDGGPATSATFSGPWGIAVDTPGNIYVYDYNGTRKITLDGNINAVPGVASGPLAVDTSGNLYVGEYSNRRLRKVSPTGSITLAAGNGIMNYSGDNGPATNAALAGPAGVALDSAGNLYVADTNNNVVRKVSTNGMITTVAGTAISGNGGFAGDGGPAVNASLSQPEGVATDGNGNLYITDSGNCRVRKVAAVGTITTVAGNAGCGFSGDGGPAANSALLASYGIAVDSAGNIYVADGNNNRVRKISTSGIITTVAGGGTANPGDGGQATNAQLNSPSGIALDGAGNLYIADTFNYRIRKVDSSGIISTVAGNGNVAGLNDVPDGASALAGGLYYIYSIGADRAGNVFFWDYSRIRMIRTNGSLVTIAGTTLPAYSGDGRPAALASVSGSGFFSGFAVSGTGSVYAADNGNNAIRLLQPIPLAVSGPSTLPSALIGQPYSQTLTAVGGLQPYSWSVSSAMLPAGLSLSSTGVISGTSTAAGTATFSVTVTDSSPTPGSASATLTLTLINPAPTINSLGTTSATAGAPAFSLIVNGNGFTGTSQAQWNGNSRAATLIGPSQLAVALTTADLATPGTFAVTVVNPAPGGGSSYVAPFNVIASCSYQISSTSVTIAGTAYSGSVAVTAPGGCAWTAASNASFLSVTSGASGSGSGSVRYSVAPNPGASRTGTLTIAGQTFSVTQGAPATSGKQYIITTIAGGVQPPITPTPALSTGIGTPQAITIDSAGNVYFCSSVIGSSGNILLKLDSSGMVAHIGVGAGGVFGTEGVAVDTSGNVYTGTFNSRVLVVSPSGASTTVAGGGTMAAGSSGAATSVGLSGVGDMGLDGAGNLYFIESFPSPPSPRFAGTIRIRKVTPAGVISTVGSITTTNANNNPQHLAVDAAGDVYFDQGAQVNLLSASGTVSVVAGTGLSGYSGDGGAAASAQIATVTGLALDGAGNLYIAQSPNYIRRVSTDGTITRIVGTSTAGFSGDGGPATSAQTFSVSGVTVDSSGNLYFGDVHRIRKISAGGIITTIAGNGTTFSAGDGGPATSAEMVRPTGLGLDSAGNLYVTDTTDNLVRRILKNGTISTVAGSPSYQTAFGGDGGPAISAQIYQPTAVSFDASGNLYIADSSNARIRQVSAITGVITTVAGGGASTGDGGQATSAQLKYPDGVALSSTGAMFISDLYGYRVRMVSGGGTISTLAGTGTAGSSGDGGPAANAQLNGPSGVAVDASGSVYVVDSSGSSGRVRKVGVDGTISTVAGGGTANPGDGGLATAAQLGTWASGVAVDNAGNLYVTDISRVHQISPSGIITTIAGNGTTGYSGDGGPATNAQLAVASGIAVDSSGNIYVADNNNSAIRMLTPQPLGIATSPTLAAATIGAAYSQTLAASGGTLPYSWSLASGNLPPGLTLSSTGTIAGTPTASGTYTFGVKAADSASATMSSLVTLVVDYIVGDVFPSSSDSAGSFGDATLNTLDLVAMLRVIVAIDPMPKKCSDRFDAIDAFPPDTAGAAGGDGLLNTLDLITVLKRVVNLDTTRPARAPRNSCTSTQTPTQRNAPHGGPSDGTLELVPAGATGDGWQRTAVYLQADLDLDLAGLSLSLTTSLPTGSGAPWRFAASSSRPPSITDTGVPGRMGLAWLNEWTVLKGARVLLGYVDTPPGESPSFLAASANAIDGREVGITFGSRR